MMIVIDYIIIDLYYIAKQHVSSTCNTIVIILLTGLIMTSSVWGGLVRGLVTLGCDCLLYGVLVLGETPDNLRGLLLLLSANSLLLTTLTIALLTIGCVPAGWLLLLVLLLRSC